ncbi:AmiR/NasT family two-component response regulator [Arthrobacter sp. CAN_A2]
MEKTRQLQDAVDSWDVFSQAKGILRERHQITGEQAFIVVSMASQRAT